MPKSDVKALFASFGQTGEGYKELADQHAGASAQQAWPLLRSFAPARPQEATPPAAAERAVPAKERPLPSPQAADGQAFPLLGNVRFGPLARPTSHQPAERQARPASSAAAPARGSLDQLFSRLAAKGGRTQQTGPSPTTVEPRPASNEALGNVFSRLSGQAADHAEASIGGALFSRLRK